MKMANLSAVLKEYSLIETTDFIDLRKPCAKPRELANKLLGAAREAKDRHSEASMLTDLGVVDLREGAFQQGIDRFDQAVALARQLQDPCLESDALTNQALAYLGNGQHQRALAILEQEIVRAQTAGDLYQEKTALDHMGMVHAVVGNNVQALEVYQRALVIAEKVGDREHQADLLWLVAVQHAQLGGRDQAMTFGRMAIDLYQELGNPNAAEFAENLRQYSRGTSSIRLMGNKEVREGQGGYPAPNQQNDHLVATMPPSGPRLLWNVFLAAKSLAKFFASGMKRVTSAIYRERLESCAGCPHHTGVRCKICGCFTNLKAWVPHAKCPIGNWSASVEKTQ
jgi:tetratricopeptide (TPR) repeat protein